MEDNKMARMTEEEYRKHPGVNKSTLWEIRKSPLHYKWALENPSEDTQAMKMGRAIHAAVLQPEDFNDMFAISPVVDRRTSAGKAAWAAFVERCGNREVITEDENVEVVATANSVHEYARGLLAGCATEFPMFWTDERTGIDCKCRVDAVRNDDDKIVLIDLKTTADASTDVFTRSALKYGYHVQAAHYINGTRAYFGEPEKPVEWWFVAVEKKAPYAVNIIKAEESFLAEGQRQLAVLMNKLKECRDYDIWPGYGTNTIRMPEWAISEEDE